MSIITYVSALLVALIIIFSSFLSLCLSDTWFISQFEKQDTYKNTNKDLADSTMHSITKFLNNKTNKILNLTDKEMSHMLEVRQRINFVLYLLISTIFLLVITLSISCLLNHKVEYRKIFLLSGILSIAILFILSLPFLINFTYSFAKFHELFFPRGNWAFNPNSYILTRILSENIFYAFVQHFVGLCIFVSGILICISKSNYIEK